MEKKILADQKEFDCFKIALMDCTKFKKEKSKDFEYLGQRFKLHGEILKIQNKTQLFNWITEGFVAELIDNPSELCDTIKNAIYNENKAGYLFNEDEVDLIEMPLTEAELRKSDKFELFETEEELEKTQEVDFTEFAEWFEHQGPYKL